jgi:hypothetical protein
MNRIVYLEIEAYLVRGLYTTLFLLQQAREEEVEVDADSDFHFMSMCRLAGTSFCSRLKMKEERKKKSSKKAI